MKANTKDFSTLIMEKKETLDIIEDLLAILASKEEDCGKEWAKVGTKQKKKWNGDEDQLVWMDGEGNQTLENTGKPYMVDDYDYVAKAVLSDRDKARLSAIEKIRETLASLA